MGFKNYFRKQLPIYYKPFVILHLILSFFILIIKTNYYFIYISLFLCFVLIILEEVSRTKDEEIFTLQEKLNDIQYTLSLLKKYKK